MILNGLSDFQRDLMKTEKNLEKAMKESVRVSGNKAVAHVRKKARSEVGKVTGNYHKKWKRGKVFTGQDGAITTRVINSSTHAHLIENGHVITNEKGGPSLGFVPGKKVLERGMSEYNSTADFTNVLSDSIDKLLEKNKL